MHSIHYTNTHILYNAGLIKTTFYNRVGCWITSVKRNFWLHAICACTEQHSTYEINWENWWLGLRVWCLGKCVGLGFVLQLEKENKSNIFTGFTYSRGAACCGYLTSNQKVLIYTIHIKTLFLYSEKQNNWQTTKVRNFACLRTHS